MQTLNLPKVDGVSVEPAIEYNSLGYELQNLVTSTGQTFDGADLNQLGKAMSAYAAGGDFYVDTGAANAYVLGVVGGKQPPKTYFDGRRIRFLPANPNNGASTVNVAGLGVKAIKSDVAGTALLPGEINTALVEAFYNDAGGYFVLANHYSNIKAAVGSVRMSAGQLIIDSDPNVKVQFDTVEFDPNGFWNATDKRWQPNIPGWYEFSVILYGKHAAPGEFLIELYKNGAPVKRLSEQYGLGDDTLSGSCKALSNGTTDYFHVITRCVGGNVTAGDDGVGSIPTISAFEIEYLGR